MALQSPQLTAKMKERLPLLQATADQPDPIAQVKFFTPDADWTWYAIEFDGDDTFFGLVVGNFTELGSFSLRELQEVRGRLGLPVEVDCHFPPTPLSVLWKAHPFQA